MEQEPTASETPPPLSAQAIQETSDGLQPNEKNWAIAAHLASVAGWVGIPMGHILAPLIVWLVKKDESEFIRSQAIESLNFQISMTIYAFVAIVVAFTVIGLVIAIPALIAIVIGDILFTVLGALAVADGKPYRYPCTVRLLN